MRACSTKDGTHQRICAELHPHSSRPGRGRRGSSALHHPQTRPDEPHRPNTIPIGPHRGGSVSNGLPEGHPIRGPSPPPDKPHPEPEEVPDTPSPPTSRCRPGCRSGRGSTTPWLRTTCSSSEVCHANMLDVGPHRVTAVVASGRHPGESAADRPRRAVAGARHRLVELYVALTYRSVIPGGLDALSCSLERDHSHVGPTHPGPPRA